MSNTKELKVFKNSQQKENYKHNLSGGSYTKFIFPFTHVRQRFSGERKEPCFEPIEMNSADWIHRKRYLTEETANVLYNRATWYELSSDSEVANYALETGTYPIEIMRPKLVMFEWRKTKSEESLLCLGFLVIEARILSAVHDESENKPVFEDLLKFNELYRYWRIPFEGKETDIEKLYSPSIESNKMDKNEKSTSYKLFLDKWLRLLKCPIKDENGYVWNITSEESLKCSTDWWKHEYDNSALSNENPGIFAYNDDRCFVWTCALINGGEQGLGEKHEDDEYHANWVKLLNVDLPVNDAWRPTSFELDWVKERTYTRWRHYGCLYGFNHHSGVMLSDLSKEPPTWQHFSEQYFDMLMLMLYLKVTLFKFSRRLSEMSGDAIDHGDIDLKHNSIAKNTKEKFSLLREEFALFTNLYQFPLISNHQQAIEMYLLMRKHLDVDDFFKEVEAEIKSTHEMFELQYTSKLSSKADKIAGIGIPVAIGAFFVALFSIPSPRALSISDAFNTFQIKVGNFLEGEIVITLPIEAIWTICIVILVASYYLFRSK